MNPPPFVNGGDEGFPKWARLGGMRNSEEQWGDAKKGGDDLRIGGMALLNDNFL